MRADERKMVARRVVVLDRTPALIVVAVLALGPEPGGMRVVRTMAAVAVFRDLVPVIAAAMAAKTIDRGVRTEKVVARFLEVIELRRLPFLGAVAFAAVWTASAAMLVVGRVAVDAGPRRVLVAAADVARIAREGRMRPGQFEVRAVVIEAPAGPGRGAVALPARLRELTLVYVIALVAAGADGDDLAPGLVRLVARAAFERRVGALERKIRQMMIELRAA